MDPIPSFPVQIISFQLNSLDQLAGDPGLEAGEEISLFGSNGPLDQLSDGTKPHPKGSLLCQYLKGICSCSAFSSVISDVFSYYFVVLSC